MSFVIAPSYFDEGTLFRSAEIMLGETRKVFNVGYAIRAAFVYHCPDRELGLSKINYAIHVYAAWQNGELNLLTDSEKNTIYGEVPERLCVNEFKSKVPGAFFAQKTAEKEWTISFAGIVPTHVAAFAAAAVGASQLNLFDEKVKDYDGTTRDNHPAFFCDAIYNGFVRCNDIVGNVTSPDDVSEKFALADLHPMFATSYEATPFEETTKGEVDKYWTWESCLKGEHRLDYEWAPEAVEHIPPLSTLDAFIPTADFISMLAITEQSLGRIKKRMDDGKLGEEALGDDAVNLKLSGPPGSGKSFALKCLAAVLGMPFWVTSFNPNSDESFAEGKTRMVGAEPRHTDAPLTLCQMYGGISAGEEPNTGDPEMIFGVYSQIVESPYTLYRNGCEAIIRHPLSVYALLYNKNCGSATMHPALLNRFNQPFKFEPAAKDEFVSMLLKRSSSSKTSDTEHVDSLYNDYAKRRKTMKRTPRNVCEWIYKAYNCVMNSLDSSSGRDAAEAISLRSCFGVLQAIQDGEDPKKALRCLTDNIGDFDEELEQSIARALNDTMRAL